jgi:hypothetical protein
MTGKQKVTVTERALIQRINRKLAKDGEKLRTTRGHFEPSLGRHYVIDLNRNFVVRKQFDLEELGRQLNVLQPWEDLADDEP